MALKKLFRKPEAPVPQQQVQETHEAEEAVEKKTCLFVDVSRIFLFPEGDGSAEARVVLWNQSQKPLAVRVRAPAKGAFSVSASTFFLRKKEKFPVKVKYTSSTNEPKCPQMEVEYLKVGSETLEGSAEEYFAAQDKSKVKAPKIKIPMIIEKIETISTIVQPKVQTTDKDYLPRKNDLKNKLENVKTLALVNGGKKMEDIVKKVEVMIEGVDRAIKEDAWLEYAKLDLLPRPEIVKIIGGKGIETELANETGIDERTIKKFLKAPEKTNQSTVNRLNRALFMLRIIPLPAEQANEVVDNDSD